MGAIRGMARSFGLLAMLFALASAVLPATAQSPAGRMPRIRLLGVTSAAGYARQVEALRQGFRDLGYVEGQNIVIAYRWADGRYDRLPALAAVVQLQPDVIVTSGPGTRVLKEATTISIVMAVAGDALAEGLVGSLARPGGTSRNRPSLVLRSRLSAWKLCPRALCLVSVASQAW